MSYVQGFLVAVPKANKQAYVESARRAAPIFKEYGATRMMETWSEDIADGKVTDFKRAVQAKDDEAIVFRGSNGPTNKPMTLQPKKWKPTPAGKTCLKCRLMAAE